MPEIKNSFTGGKMNKDLDERLVPNGEYRDAMNIQVSTSEDSDVGTVQNILGNYLIPGQLISRNQSFDIIPDNSVCIGGISDEKNDTLYWFVTSPNRDLILQYSKNDGVKAVLVDNKVNTPDAVLKFDADNIVTGINIIDGMLFWTDNMSEPKKVNIQRCIDGTTDPTVHTKLINDVVANSVFGFLPVDIEEKHITVIKKSPASAPILELETSRDPDKIYSFSINTTYGNVVQSSFIGSNGPGGLQEASNFTTFQIDDTVSIRTEDIIYTDGTIETFVPTTYNPFVSNMTMLSTTEFREGSKIVLRPYNDDGELPGLPITDYSIKGVIQTLWTGGIAFKISNIEGIISAPSQNVNGGVQKWVVDLYDEDEKLFEFKFPRFAYRYKYEDGEYSAFSPFTQVAFIPGAFDYHPRKGYNLGMTNRLNKVIFKDFINNSTPEDVVAIDILYKEEGAPNVYVVDSIVPDIDADVPGGEKDFWWNNQYTITKETIKSTVPSNQILRPWDSVPKKALAQDITGNRIVYGNYVQNYTLESGDTGKKYFVDFTTAWRSFDAQASGVSKSIKSLREYQLGVVFVDEYGRETPVLSAPSGTMKLEKENADNSNRIEVKLNGEAPSNMKYFKFFVKETAGEYYNMAMDRFYDAEDGNVWLAFPSSDRNKLDIDTFLILKKGSDSDDLVNAQARYKVIAIENEAPDYIKISRLLVANIKYTSGVTGKDIFNEDTLVDNPIAGSTEFKLKYDGVFSSSSAANLHEIKSGEVLYIEFTDATSQVSERYKISELSLGLKSDGNVETHYKVSLDEPLGEDVNFITDDPEDPSKIKDGTFVRIYKYKVENKPQFDGRFFVKIHKDEIFRENIKTTVVSGAEYKTEISKKVYSINSDMTSFINNTRTGTSSALGGFQSAFGGRFRSFSFYFDKYVDRTVSLLNSASNQIVNRDIIARSSVATPTSLGEQQTNVDWYESLHAEIGVDSIGFTYLDSNTQVYLDDDVKAIKTIEEQSGRDNEVWFIDGGPYMGSRSNNSMDWDSTNHTDELKEGKGIDVGTDSWRMELGLGPIKYDVDKAFPSYTYKPPVDVDRFFGIGNYTTATNMNPQYQDANTVDFVNRIFPAGQFRWREDPDPNRVYNIKAGNVSTHQRIRYRAGQAHAGGLTGADGRWCYASSGANGIPLTKWSQNFTSGFGFNVEGNIGWNPWDDSLGKIEGGSEIEILISTPDPQTSSTVTDDKISHPAYGIQIYVDTKRGDDIGGIGTADISITEGMALTAYHKADGSLEDLAGAPARMLIIESITNIAQQGSSNPKYQINLVGYGEALRDGNDNYKIFSEANLKPVAPASNKIFRFSQVKMNGLSPNAAFRISNSYGPIAAVGYNFDFVVPVEEITEELPENPAIWETEPKELTELDIYFEGTGYLPIELDLKSASWAIPIGTKIEWKDGNIEGEVIGYKQGQTDNNVGIDINWGGFGGVTINLAPAQFTNIFTMNNPGYLTLNVTRTDGLEFEIKVEAYANGEFVTFDPGGGLPTTVQYQETIFINKFLSNTNWSLPWYNCFSFGNGVESNRIRDNFNLPFIANGVKASTTLEEEYTEERRKYGLIYSGIYNSISGVNNLNQFIQAEKITKDVNPIYGSIQKLHSRDTDLVTLCEDKVLKILANKDAVFNADGNTNLTATENVLGQTIPFAGEYGISTNPESFASEAYRAYFTDKVRGKVLRLSRDGLTPISDAGMSDWFKDNLKISTQLIGSYDDRKDEYNLTLERIKPATDVSVTFNEKVRGWSSFKSFVPEIAISMANDYYSFQNGLLYQHHSEEVDRNTFYGNFTESSVNVILNQSPSTIKSFNTLNYEGSDSKINKFVEVDINGKQYTDQQDYNLNDKDGWYVSSTKTNEQDGEIKEFIKKEGKFFNYIRGLQQETINTHDPSEFSFQGIADADSISIGSSTSTQTTSVTTRSGDTDTETEQEQEVDETPDASDTAIETQNILTNIDGIPLFSTPQQALNWAQENGLLGYHIHVYQGVTGYMGGSDHNNAVTGSASTNTSSTGETSSGSSRY